MAPSGSNIGVAVWFIVMALYKITAKKASFFSNQNIDQLKSEEDLHSDSSTREYELNCELTGIDMRQMKIMMFKQMAHVNH